MIGALFLFFILIIGFHYRNALAYYFSFKSPHERNENKAFAIRNFKVLSDHDDRAIGFDVSEYQGKIAWTLVDSIDRTFPLDFVFIRATAGKNYTDRRFKQNWKAAKEVAIMRGAYHYYRPDENSIAQANLFIKNVRLRNGDLPPVLDIERVPKGQSVDSLKKGLRRWLSRVESHYKVKPIIYCGQSYYADFLEKEFSDYPLWIANYNFWVEKMDSKWQFWQFTEKGTIPGIIGPVDVNIFKGSPEDLDDLAIRHY